MFYLKKKLCATIPQLYDIRPLSICSRAPTPHFNRKDFAFQRYYLRFLAKEESTK